jgi:hypothetical protein
MLFRLLSTFLLFPSVSDFNSIAEAAVKLVGLFPKSKVRARTTESNRYA